MKAPTVILPPMIPEELKDVSGVPLFTVLDRAIAREWVAQMSEPVEEEYDSNWLRLAAALCHRAARAGHTCIDLREIPADLASLIPHWPDVATWRSLLEAKATPDQPHPWLIWTEPALLYLRKFWLAEMELAARLGSMASTPAAMDGSLASDFLESLVAGCSDGQAHAVRSCIDHRLILLSGGPGTGKTFTVLRCMAAILAQRPDAVIQLCAPTGKAVGRLMESVRQGLPTLPVPEALRQRIPTKAQTIHRLLITLKPPRPDAMLPPIVQPIDWVFIDEASMVDLPLMHQLLHRIPQDCRVCILGDVDQLASVDPGAVFADLFHAFAHPNDAAASGGACAIRLRQAFRFAEHSPLNRLCQAVQQGDSEAVWKVLRSGDPDAAVVWDTPGGRSGSSILDNWVETVIHEAATSSNPGEALRAYRRLLLLSGTNEGPTGVTELNRKVLQRVTRHLLALGHEQCRVPLIITQNDRATGLFNGEVGVRPYRIGSATGSSEGSAWFEQEAGTCREVPCHQLPPHRDAFALTIHKSQGSEARRVVVILPSPDSPLLSRELLYTAISRARESLLLIAHPESVERCLRSPTIRQSGLRRSIRSFLPG
jgi:exodeoxyribonuclease V alpha subunit